MKNSHLPVLAGIAAISLSLLACEPVFVVGWNEFFLLCAVVGILLGPPLLRFLMKRAEYRKKNQKGNLTVDDQSHNGWTCLHGILVQGYRVASGPSTDYPYGALDRQRPIFKARGLDLSGYFNGTLNVDISPRTFKLIKPGFTFYSVEWTDLHPPEHFSFSHCRVVYKDVEYKGWVYYPHPETKLRNFQNPSLLEVIAYPIPEIRYEDKLQVLVNPEEVEVQ